MAATTKFMNSRQCSGSFGNSKSSTFQSTASSRDDDDNNNNSRVEGLKKRFAGLIDKSQKAIDDVKQIIKHNNTDQKIVNSPALKRAGNHNITKRCFGKTLTSESKQSESVNKKQRVSNENVVAKKNDFFFDLNMVAAGDDARKRKIDEKFEVDQKKINLRKLEIQKMREAARKEIEEMKNVSGICDPQEVMREFEKLIGYDHSVIGYTEWPYDYPFHSGVNLRVEDDKLPVKGRSFADHSGEASQEVEEGEIQE